MLYIIYYILYIIYYIYYILYIINYILYSIANKGGCQTNGDRTFMKLGDGLQRLIRSDFNEVEETPN